MRAGAAVFTAFVLVVAGCSFPRPMKRPTVREDVLILRMPGAASVQVLSDWNEWGGLVSSRGMIDPTAGLMTRSENGSWVFEVPKLDGGAYRYVFLVDGHLWVRDALNPLVSDFMGREVSLLVVND